MDEDKTFLKLKRVPFLQALERLRQVPYAGHLNAKDMLLDLGWTLGEFNIHYRNTVINNLEE